MSDVADTAPALEGKFTEQGARILTNAQEEARRFNHNYIGTEHILLGLVQEQGAVSARVLARCGVELHKVRSAVEFIIGRGDRTVLGEIGYTPRAKKVVELALDEMRRMGNENIGTEHILLGLIREGEGIAAGVLESLGVNLDNLRIMTQAELNSVNKAGKVDIPVEDIMKVIPHRPPMLLIDRVIAVENGVSATAIKNVTVNEWFFEGHFPDRKVMPGVLIVEALAQTAAFAMLRGVVAAGMSPLFGGIEDMRFRRPVVPGDQLVLEFTLEGSIRRNMGKGKVKATVGGKIVAMGVISFALVDLSAGTTDA